MLAANRLPPLPLTAPLATAIAFGCDRLDRMLGGAAFRESCDLPLRRGPLAQEAGPSLPLAALLATALARGLDMRCRSRTWEAVRRRRAPSLSGELR